VTHVTLDPAPGSAPGLVVCVGLPSDQIIEIAHLLRGRATVLATPDAEGARAVLANQATPRRAGGPARRGLGVLPERFENPGPAAEQTYGRQLPEGPADRLVESDNPTAVGRAVTGPMLNPLVAGPLFVDLAGREVTARGRRVYLSAREFDLLATLALEAGRVWSFAELTARVWQLPYLGDSDPVTSAVKRLRKRLAPVRDVEVASVRGVGYRLRVRS
jgi:Transcriptional regulatory protein, C terminal